MADLTIKYKDQPIAELSESGTKTLATGGKYCEDDITVEYTKPSGNAELFTSAASGSLAETPHGLGASELSVSTNIFAASAIGWLPEYQIVHAVSVLDVSTDIFETNAVEIVRYYKDSAAEVASGTTLTSQVACNVGDLVVAAIVARSPLTVSDGWTLIGTSTAIASDDLNQTLSWAYKYAESESESITVTQETANRIYINMCSLQGATGYIDNGFVYNTTTDTTSFTTTKPSGLTLWAASKPTWSTSAPHGVWTISNDSQATQLDQASAQPRLALFYDQSDDSKVTFTSGASKGVCTFGSLTIQGMTAFTQRKERK